MTLGGWEGFVAVREDPFWALYYDLDGDLLRSKGLPEDTPVLEVELRRIEMRTPKPVIPPPAPPKEESGADGPQKEKENGMGEHHDAGGEQDDTGEGKLESPEVD